MKIKPLFLMIGLAVILSGFIVVQHFTSFLIAEKEQIERRIDPNWVQGSAVMGKEKLYTLNFSQQNELLRIINDSELFASTIAEMKPPINTITIYRFPKEPEIKIIAKGLVNNKIVYQAEAISKDTLFIEKEGGSLKKLINSSTDTL